MVSLLSLLENQPRVAIYSFSSKDGNTLLLESVSLPCLPKATPAGQIQAGEFIRSANPPHLHCPASAPAPLTSESFGTN